VENKGKYFRASKKHQKGLKELLYEYIDLEGNAFWNCFVLVGEARTIFGKNG